MKEETDSTGKLRHIGIVRVIMLLRTTVKVNGEWQNLTLSRR